MKTTLLAVFAAWLIASGCHTYAWEPVADEIEGTWTRQPVQPNYMEVWTFDNGKLTININGFFLQFMDDNGNPVSALDYRIDNLITNHYLIIENLRTTSGTYYLHETVRRWLIIQSDPNEIYISSESDNGLKGGYQFHFFKL